MGAPAQSIEPWPVLRRFHALMAIDCSGVCCGASSPSHGSACQSRRAASFLRHLLAAHCAH